MRHEMAGFSANGDALALDRAPRIAFLFNAQAHQLLHGISIAESLARSWHIGVDIVSPSDQHLALAQRLTDKATHRLLRFENIGSPFLGTLANLRQSAIPPKALTLFHARRRLDQYTAIALPERTSTLLRRFGVTQPKLIHTDHGAGDRAVGYDPRIALFDFALLAGRKQERRMLDAGLIKSGHYAIVGYPKFDAADRLRSASWTPFADRRPIVLYNPHFSRELGSWWRHGPTIVDRVASDGRYNLIVAPHIRLCDDRKSRRRFEAALAPYADLPNVFVDTGSDRLIDMTYTSTADIYVGDVSSQIYEFLRTPRPALFVNSGRRDWRGDANYAHWALGPVIDEPTHIADAIANAIATHDAFTPAQHVAIRDTFDTDSTQRASDRAADAIAAFLNLQRVR
ncbi:CDP-glycerol glycerophosphotransferase family protein [Sphingomonas montanisoli]|uniref:Glycosyl transferase n=1 Tax=Sphingomonas montanisoli TaxID=2606412 RepID=A0A5D9C5S1_9SPHN|nr:CDP-glycerol glycerophosphotransferase family protein [Sphingomonas montanisoli]TZG27144.1 hypothetical protein FYJ91_05815 [Sphingomonas montanisoli]